MEWIYPTSNSDYFDGAYFECNIKNVAVKGKITISNNKIYLCQNTIAGGSPRDKKGYANGWELDHNVDNMKIARPTEEFLANMKKELIEKNKTYAKNFKPSGNEYFPLCNEDILEGDRFTLSAGDRFHIGKVIVEKGIKYSTLDNHGIYQNISSYNSLKDIRDRGYRFYHEDFDFGFKSLDDVKVGSIIFDLVRMCFDCVTNIHKGLDKERIYVFYSCMRNESEVCHKKMTDEELKEIFEKEINNNPEYAYLHRPNQFSYEESKLLNTQNGIVTFGTILNGTNHFNKYQNVYLDNIVSASRVKRDMEVYIPVEYLNYLGYSELHLQNYMNLLNSIFEQEVYTYKGICECGFFKPTPLINILSKTKKKELLFNNSFYKVWIKSSGSILRNSMYYTMLSYISNSTYKNIPYLFMQMHDKMSSSIGLWKTFLFAHSVCESVDYFALFVPSSKNAMIDLEENDLCKVLFSFKKENEEHILSQHFEYCEKPHDAFVEYRKLVMDGEYKKALDKINFDIL